MEPQHPRQRAGMGLASKGGCSQRPRIRHPVERLDRQTFSFHFRNLRFASERNCTYLCYQVERLKHCSPDFSDWGVFQNWVYACHVELCFLSWFRAKKLSSHEQYHITWFLSWSPCLSCAEQVVAFLKENRNVRLSIFAARLYYFWDPDYQHGLRILHDQRAWVRIMSFRDFKYCWKNFVYNQGMPFKPWKKLRKNYQFLVAKLHEILGISATKRHRLGDLTTGVYFLTDMEARSPRSRSRNTMNLLKPNIFRRQFGNQPRVPQPCRRRKTYLCYQLKQLDGFTLDKGCFQNKKQRHAEIRFIDKITSLNLDPNQRYKIICYVTWSPCAACAGELVDFINGQDNLSLQIFASRLYFHWVKVFQRGLQQLQAAQVSVAVMTRSEFEDCWEEFVDNQGMPFESWDKLEQYSESISRRLQRILSPSNWNNLEDSFRDLRLGSPSPSSLRSDSR
ncbi:DNA dC-_dU-editing enzyme APOBEC-3B-like isoform X1 [Globicephala melas]|uniref:DNA dC->dU-editing enzyme APOBEC-3B-like isoform X1 n=1 Tax=Globicephala melas TaxID=9731 RepID=UPI00122FA99B|nr:DNA dC->dU-editing enzyme APOBEC-3G-like isoform X1 [Globicephala melas]